MLDKKQNAETEGQTGVDVYWKVIIFWVISGIALPNMSSLIFHLIIQTNMISQQNFCTVHYLLKQ